MVVSGAHEKEEEMEIELAFTLGLFYSSSSAASAFGLPSGLTQVPGITGSGGKTQVERHFSNQTAVHTQARACAIRS